MAIDKSMIQGSMSILVLRLLSEKDMYGYEITDTLKNRSNDVFSLKAGSLYPLLHTMESNGYVNSYESDSAGKRRKYYHLTKDGEKYLQNKKEEWKEYQAAMTSILTLGTGNFASLI